MGCDPLLYPTGSAGAVYNGPERKFVEGLDLQPCPFCGAPARLAVVDYDVHSAAVECSDEDRCGADGPAHFSVKEAVDGWNTRRSR